jgi:uncharacterized OB-fold protein
MPRKIPTPTELSEAFWAGAADHRLLVPRCDETGAYFFPPERLCPGTSCANWSYVESAGLGTVATYTVVHRAPSPDFEVPYILAVVDMDEGWTMLTHLVGCDPDSVTIGMRVGVRFQDCEDDKALPVFAPEASLPNGATPQGKAAKCR